MPLVAISASYGALGSRVGPALAERLGVPFLDRAIPLAVAEKLDVPLDDVAAHEDQGTAGWLERLLRGFVGSDPGVPAPVPAEIVTSDDFRRATEQVLRRHAESGHGVILGRAAVIVLRDDPRALRVRLHGPPERRLERAIALSGLDRETSTQAMAKADRAQEAYVKHFYGARLDDPCLYHLMIDSTAIPLDAVVEMIAHAATARYEQPQ